MFKLPDGRLKSSASLQPELRKLGGHRQLQVIQKKVDHVVIRLLADRSWTESHEGRFRQTVRDFFEAPIRVDVSVEERLELPSGGKLQGVICEVPLQGS